MIRIWRDWQEARDTLLRRREPESREVPEPLQQAIEAVFGERLEPDQAVARVLADVKRRGDEALRDWTLRTDGVKLSELEVPRSDWQDAYDGLRLDLREAMEHSAERIRAFHARQPVASWSTEDLGGMLGQRVVPLQRVGVYVPGGSAPLPSSLLMAVVPACVAGVHEVVVCTPPRSGGSHAVADVILAAACIAGVDRVFAVGGAQAIAAMAFGTASVPCVDKIVGAGGFFVTLAKRQVYGRVGLDGVYGPTETLIVADDTAEPAWIAADLLAQAEHDALATAILLTPSVQLAARVQEAVTLQMETLERAEVVAAALASQGGIVVTPDLETALALADAYAPEHLCLSVGDPEAWSERVQNAGGIFLGEHSFEVLGDYMAGPSHIMPTGGTARFSSALSVLDFVKFINIIGLDRETAAELCRGAGCFAWAESLTAHAAAAEKREGRRE